MSDVVVADNPVDHEVPAAPPDPERSMPRWLPRVGVNLGVIALFTLPAVFLWWDAWSGGASSTVRCSCWDDGQQVWFIAWPAYALAHGLSPFSSAWLWSPHGVNLLDNASSPLAGIVLSPVTWLFGPFVSTTLALTLAPGLSAWGCWLACRRFVEWQPACWVAAFVFGYSPFVVGSAAAGHLSIALLVFPPLILVVLHEILVRQRWSPMRCGLALGALLFGQFLVSAEILTILVPVAVVGIAVAVIASPRRALASFPFAIRALGIGALTALVLLAVPVGYMLAGPQHIHGSVWSGLQDFLVARAYTLWSAGTYQSTSFGVPDGPPVAFMGFGVILVALASVAIAWRRPALWVMAIVALTATVFSWGGFFFFSGDHFFTSHWLPWSWFTNQPVVDNIIAGRFSALADLGVAVVIAIGLDALHRSLPWHLPRAGWGVLVVAVAALMLVPVWVTYEAPLVVQPVELPPWYTTAALTVPQGSVITSYPFPASSTLMAEPMVWQAADGMRFRLAGGYIKVPGRGHGTIGSGLPGSGVQTMVHLTVPPTAFGSTFPLTAYQMAQLRSSIRYWRTSYIVVTDTGSKPTEAAAVLTAATGMLPEIAHRAWVWNLRAHPLRGPYDATAASRAFASCRLTADRLGTVPADEPLSQAFNRCVLNPGGSGGSVGAA